MVLSNAERQARYRKRLKAAARGDDMGERVRAAIDEALSVMWALGKGKTGDFDEFDSLDDFRRQITTARFIKYNGPPSVTLRDYFAAYVDDADEDQRAPLERAIAVLDAVSLRDAAD